MFFFSFVLFQIFAEPPSGRTSLLASSLTLSLSLGTRRLTCPNVYLRNFDDFAVLVPLLHFGGVEYTLIELIQESELDFPVVESNLGAFLATTHASFCFGNDIIFLSEFNSTFHVNKKQSNVMLFML